MACGAAAFEVNRVTPAGEDVPAGHQITIEFDRDVAPLGAVAATEAQRARLVVQPAPGCEWRWLGLRTLACQLGRSHSSSGCAESWRGVAMVCVW